MKTKYLIKMSLDKKFKTKWFKVVNIILFLVIALVINIDNVINFFGGDFNKKTVLNIIDNTEISEKVVEQNINITLESVNKSTNNDLAFDIKSYDKSEEELKKDLKDDIGIIIDKDEENTIKFKIISEGYISAIDYQIIETALVSSKVQIALSLSNINAEELNNVYSAPSIEREYLDELKKSDEESMAAIMSTVFPIIILPFFMLTIFLVQMIGAEINDEKTTKGMEIIISSVSPKQHFFSKVISSNIFVIVQGLLLIAYSSIGLFIRSSINHENITSIVTSFVGSALNTEFASKLVYIIPSTLILMLITFLGYSLVAGILSSVTTSPEDFQQVQTPIMVVLMIGYYLSIMASSFEGSIFIKVMAYIPFISAILAPSLLVLGQFSLINVIISGIIMVVVDFLLIKYGLKVYKVGILNYSSKDLWKKIFKSLKE